MISPKDMVGTPYSKMDCFTLVRKAALLMGIKLPEAVEHSPRPELVVAEQLDTGKWLEVPYDDMQPGDVITLSPKQGPAGHVGIVIDSGEILHADRKLGAVIQDQAGLRRRGFLYRRFYRWVP